MVAAWGVLVVFGRLEQGVSWVGNNGFVRAIADGAWTAQRQWAVPASRRR